MTSRLFRVDEPLVLLGKRLFQLDDPLTLAQAYAQFVAIERLADKVVRAGFHGLDQIFLLGVTTVTRMA